MVPSGSCRHGCWQEVGVRRAIELHIVSYPHLLVSNQLDNVQVQHDPNATATDTSSIQGTLYAGFGGLAGGGGRGVGGGEPRSQPA